MAISATQGKRIYIGARIDAKTSDFTYGDLTAALASKTAIGWLENLGQFGDEAQEITFDAIDLGRTIKLKGSRNAGNLALVAGLDAQDAGQVALIAAEKTPDDYAFEVVWNDAVGGGQPTSRRFIGKVMTASESYDTVNNVIKLNASIGINSNIVKLAAAATPPVAPTFTTQPTITGAGATKTATVGIVTGTLPVSFSVRWKLNGAEIARDVLTLDTTGLTGSLTVESVATNIAGAATGTSTATVLS